MTDDFDAGDEGVMWSHRRVVSLGNRRYALELSNEEREILRRLPTDLRSQIRDTDDMSTMRLFPPAYTNDLGRQVEYDRLMREELQESHLHALSILETTARAREIDEAQLLGWTKAINQIRLVLGTKLDITEDDDSLDDMAEDDPRGPAWSLYVYLAFLQNQAVDALSESL